MDRARPQGSGLNLTDSPAVTTASYQNRDIGMPFDGSRLRSKERSVDLGNGIFVPRDRRAFQPLRRRKSKKSQAQAAFSPAKPLKWRRFPQIRKRPLFVRTGWWRTQSCETGLRGLHSLITGRNAGRGVARAALWRPMRYRKRVFSMDFRHGSLLEVTGSRTGGRRECVRPEQRASGEGSVSYTCA
jgi:hypothetical protein